MPRITYCYPEVASVGLTEPQAAEQPATTSSRLTYDLAGNGKRQILNTKGAVKLVAAKDGPVLGMHIVGDRVGELIAEAQLIVQLGRPRRTRSPPDPPAPDACPRRSARLTCPSPASPCTPTPEQREPPAP